MFGVMAKFWRIVVDIERMGGGKPMNEFYLVGVGDTPQEALMALHDKEGLNDAKLQEVKEVPAIPTRTNRAVPNMRGTRRVAHPSFSTYWINRSSILQSWRLTIDRATIETDPLPP